MNKIILLVFFVLAIASNADAATLIVAKGTAIASLTKALALAKNGDTVIVKKGVYSSLNTKVEKEITLLGEDYPVLDAHYEEEVLTVLANNVTVDGFVIRNSKTGAMRDFAGIRLHRVQHVTISNNKLIDNFFGIYLSDSRYINVLNNYVKGFRAQLNSGNGIHSWQCDHIRIKGNYISGQRDGIYFEFVKKSQIEKNTSVKNYRYGLHFMFSDDDHYFQNTFKSNGSGVAVMYSKRIKMENNFFNENWGSSVYGLLLKDISLSSIRKNQFLRNTTAVYMEGCEGLSLTSNNFINNGWAIRVLANSVNNVFDHNNFKANSFDVTTNGSLSLNRFNNNYWDKYDGYDLDKDGTGDVPYRPVSLYAQIIEQIPQSVMLMRSFIVNLLDKVERAIPSLTPMSVKDEKPSMKAWKRSFE